MSNALAIILHFVSINIWVGGTFFSVVVLHSAVSSLDPAQQRLLMNAVLRRFFFWIWIVMVALNTSGGWMIVSLFGGLADAPRYIALMAVLGWLMSGVFLVMFFGPYRHYKQLLTAPDTAAGQHYLAMIRRLGVVTMVLGLCVVLVVGAGPHLFV